MKKFILFLIASFFIFSNLYATCYDEADTGWRLDGNNVYVEIRSSSSKYIYITKIQVVTSSDQVMKTFTRTSGTAATIRPYGFEKLNINASNLNKDLIDGIIWFCSYDAPERKTQLDFSKFNKKKNKSWFKWWYVPIIIVIIGFISSALDTSNTSSKTKTRKSTSSLAEGENFIFDVFEGKKPLGETFWLAFILVNIIVTFISGLLAENYDNNFLLIGAAASNIWAGVGTWNSATNYQLEKIKKKQPYGWAYGAKILVVLNFIIFGGQLIVLITS